MRARKGTMSRTSAHQTCKETFTLVQLRKRKQMKEVDLIPIGEVQRVMNREMIEFEIINSKRIKIKDSEIGWYKKRNLDHKVTKLNENGAGRLDKATSERIQIKDSECHGHKVTKYPEQMIINNINGHIKKKVAISDITSLNTQ